jgi:4-amino-4-deoxy-L-arabinose transferase-like glycosyltransferase
MSTLTRSTDAPARDGSTTSTASDEARDRTRRRVSLVVTVVVLGWSSLELINLGLTHTTGAELYGVAVAAVAVGAGALSLALLASTRRRVLASAAVLVLWAVIALGGAAGTVAHIVGPVPGDGPVDARPRPIAAPLVFTALGLLGGAALFYGQRAGTRHVREP